jgi:hypothetical protein
MIIVVIPILFLILGIKNKEIFMFFSYLFSWSTR